MEKSLEQRIRESCDENMRVAAQYEKKGFAWHAARIRQHANKLGFLLHGGTPDTFYPNLDEIHHKDHIECLECTKIVKVAEVVFSLYCSYHCYCKDYGDDCVKYTCGGVECEKCIEDMQP